MGFNIFKAKALTRKQRAEKVQKYILNICRLDNHPRPFGRRNVFWESGGKYCRGWNRDDIHIGHGIGHNFEGYPELCVISKGVVRVSWDEKNGWECEINKLLVRLDKGKWLEYLENELPKIAVIAKEYIDSINKEDEQDVLDHYQKAERALKERGKDE